MKSRTPFILITATLIACLFTDCKKKKKQDEEEDPVNAFNKQELVTNMAEQVILPSYVSFKEVLDSLTASYNIFKSSGASSDFQLVKQKFISTYFKYQKCGLYEFGPAESVNFRSSLNVFPADTLKINANISSGTYDLNNLSNIAAKGLPALDYLFYGNGSSEAGIILLFGNANRKQYVSDLLAEMSSKTNSVVNSWNDSYKNAFTASLGTDIGSSIGFLVNQVNFELDHLKNNKIGIPLGKKSLGIPYPEKCEAYYSGNFSVQLAMATLEAIENTFLGRNASGANGKGFDDYLDHLGAQHTSGPLTDAINNQFALAKNKLSGLSSPLSAQITANPALVDAAYLELVKLLVLLKTDMPSALGVVITYQDGDGD